MPHAALPNSKQLRRVAGELVLVPIKVDPIRPSTSCVPLRRSSKATTLNFTPHSASANHDFQISRNSITSEVQQCRTKTETHTRQSTFSTVQHNLFQTCSLSNSTKTESIFHSSFSEKLIVPPNSFQTSSTRSYAPPVTKILTNDPLVVLHRHIRKARRKGHVGASTHNSSTSNNATSKVDSVLSKFLSSAPSHNPTESQDADTSLANISQTPDEHNLTTAKTLELPDSQGQISRPSEWSLTNHVPTPKVPTASSVTFTTVDRNATEDTPPLTDATPTTAGGEGDSSTKSPVEKEKITAPHSLNATSLTSTASDKQEFRLTFRKPKPRPRSIMTNKSILSPLPTTASTPNARSASVHSSTNVDVRNNNLEGNDDNNNDIRPTLANTEVKKKPCNSKCSKEKLGKSVPSGEKIQTGREVVVMPVEFGEDTGAGEEAVTIVETDPFQTMPDDTLEYDREDSFWNSETTQEDTTREHEPTTEKKTSVMSTHTPTATTRSVQSSSKKKTKSYPTGSSYSQSYPYGSQQVSSEQPMLITEKGAIRFHLPGRIQHKTTIKVAHFPTGDEKNVIVNVKPDIDECEEPSCCANNQNFVVPPFPSCPTPSTYGSYPYGYGGYPYNYYGYGGYPPYC